MGGGWTGLVLRISMAATYRLEGESWGRSNAALSMFSRENFGVCVGGDNDSGV